MTRIIKADDNRELISTNNITLSEIMKEATEIQSKCMDFTITGATDRNVKINDFGGVAYISDDGQLISATISRFALGQLCSKIGVPAQYIDKCIKTGRLELVQHNMSSWLSDYNGNLFIRMYDDSVRGVLSQRYMVCDTPEIVDVVQDVFPSDDYTIRGFFLSPERFHLRITSADTLKVSGEDLFAGFSINSSDVGRSQLKVNYILYKQICTNGLCLPRGIGDLFRQKHIGITAESFREELKKSLDLVPQITAKYEQAIEKARNSGVAIRDFDNDEEIKEIIASLRKSTGLSEQQADKVITLFDFRVNKSGDFRYENNKWGLINAITEYSKEFTLERRIELEQQAGGILIA